MGSTPLTKSAATLVRILIGGGLLYILFKNTDMVALRQVLSLAKHHWSWLLGGLVLTFIGLCMGAWRWKIILAAQRLMSPGIRVFRIFFIGQFFNAFMLGACGGDMARAFYVARDTARNRAEAATTVFIDRAIGLFVTIAFCCMMIAVRIPLFLDNKGPRLAGILMLFFFLVSATAIAALLYRNLFEHWAVFRTLENKTRIGPLIRRAYEAFYLYRSQPGIMLYSILLSILNLVFLTLACYTLGCSLEIDVSLIDYFTLFPIISVLAAVPITPGSLGVREGLFVTMFQSSGVDSHEAILLSLMVYAVSIVWSLFGGLLFIGYSEKTMREELDALKALTDSPEIKL